MRLRKIRLAGFKSFVDPTTVPFPSDLIGVVGPNGCGKSNIIDAVRWVMGEISAKHLRGDSMADVVFNGSNTRKPVGQASVELVFDNSEGRVGGRYAAYGEIAVKRQVSRDGNSAYYLNGTRCRRRDITDLFLGTGLGPRSYAIIEQGMISRLIEARPEELREFIEEAAGISKYKERRRETENRIRHTRDNLDRLNDIREELDKRLNHLERQARMAEKYKTLRQEQRQLELELLALRWRDLDADARSQARAVGEQETRLDAVIASQRELEAALLRQRDQQSVRGDAYNAAYMQVQDAAAAIARAEGAIEQLELRRRQLQAGIERERASLEQARVHADAERERVAALSAELLECEPALAASRLGAQEARTDLDAREAAMHAWQSGFEELSQRAAEPAQAAEAVRAQIRAAEEQVLQYQRRMERLESERGAQDPARSQAVLQSLRERVAGLERAQQEAERGLAERQADIRSNRERCAQLAGVLDEERSELQQLKGRFASVRALQQAALGKRDGSVTRWLAQRGIDGVSRLAERLQVAPGWELAVERVLDAYLEAVCVEDLAQHAATVASLGEGSLALFEGGVEPAAISVDDEWLATHVSAPHGVRELMNGVRVAEDLHAAMALRPRLASGESVITRNGEWLGRNWLRVARGEGDHIGVLAREQEIRALDGRVGELDVLVAERSRELEHAREHLADAEDAHAGEQARYSDGQRRFAGLRAEIGQRQAEYELACKRLADVERDLVELRQEIVTCSEQASLARGRLGTLTDDMQRLSQERERWAAERRVHREGLDQARERWQTLRDVAYEAGLRVQVLRTQIAALGESETRNVEQVSALDARIAELEEELQGTMEPLQAARGLLEQRLQSRRAFERTLVAAREAVEAGEAELRALEQRRHEVEQSTLRERSSLEALRIAAQEVIVRQRTVAEQLAATEHDPVPLLRQLGDQGDPEAWAGRVAELERSIARLGAINLAAIDEFQQQSERKHYLDSQHADLEEALATLDAAIQKIDRETRARFKETYEKVNAGLTTMFPKLFGGGHAYLEMTGDDLLSTGITVMARPPGKRNSTIHLLSGGEKALTAVALVFSIFELTPAPFCLLDEVDAPLDDANVVRFSQLVREMSERVQMIIVTHNKTTMEVTQQLVGVTMQEPGVSRLVAVDVDEAVRMVAV